MSYGIDLEPATAVRAGTATAATAGQWRAWAGRGQQAWADAAAAVQDVLLTGAVETYAGDSNQASQQLALGVESLGGRTVAAARTAVDADADADGQLAPAAQAHGQHHPAVVRSVNVV